MLSASMLSAVMLSGAMLSGAMLSAAMLSAAMLSDAMLSAAMLIVVIKDCKNYIRHLMKASLVSLLNCKLGKGLPTCRNSCIIFFSFLLHLIFINIFVSLENKIKSNFNYRNDI